LEKNHENLLTLCKLYHPEYFNILKVDMFEKEKYLLNINKRRLLAVRLQI